MQYYKRLLGFFLSITTLVAVLSLVATTRQNPNALILTLVLPILLTIGLLVFVIAKWRQ